MSGKVNRIRGVLAPALTPFDAQLQPDTQRFVAHCRWLVDRGVGLALFGTNSEAASLSVSERLALTEAVLEAGVPASRLMPGTGACALSDAVTLTQHAVRHGAAGVLMLPPFYYKGVSEDGLFAYYSEVIERVADDRLAIYLYHIPQVSQVPIPLGVIERLLTRYPRQIAGAKDSGGDWSHTRTLIERFAPVGFEVFPGSESFLSQALAVGGVGCISATANVNPAALDGLYRRWNMPEGPELQAQADAVRLAFQAHPMIAAMKAAIAHACDVPSWRVVRPPLTALDPGAWATLQGALSALNWRVDAHP